MRTACRRLVAPMSAIAIIRTIARNNKPTIVILLQGNDCGAPSWAGAMKLVYQTAATASIGEMSQQISVPGSREVRATPFSSTTIYARSGPLDAIELGM